MPGYIKDDFKTEKLGGADQAVDFAVAVLSAANEGVLVADDKFNVVFANNAFCKIIGKNADDLSGFDFAEWLKRMSGDSVNAWKSAKEKSDQSFSYEMETDDAPLYFNVRVSPLEAFGPGMLVSVWRDVTSHRKLLEDLNEIRAETERADRAKEIFFSSMNHEVRTPMNGIIGMLELALDGQMSHREKEYLSLARCSAETLLNMLNNFFNFSKVEAGKLKISRIAFSLDAVMESVNASMRIGIREKGLKLYHHVAPDVPDMLLGDPDRLRQVLANLIGNAVKFTEKGYIEVAVRNEGRSVSADSEADVLLGFSIKDTGIGIHASKHETIFNSFVQADDSIGRSFGGVGLGLSISKQIVQLMGGDIRVESEVGKGSAFHFTARFGKTDQNAIKEVGDSHIAEPAGEGDNRPAILLAEDDRDIGNIFREFLEGEGYGVTVATDGSTALGLAKDRKFDLILMDIGLPEMNGFEVSKNIRKNDAAIPIIVLTGDALHEYEKEIAEAGVNDFISKPVSRKIILDTVAKHLPGYGQNVRAPAEALAAELDRLQTALDSGQFDVLENIANELKTMASDAGAQDLGDEAFRLKLAARKGDAGKAAALAGSVKKEYEIFKSNQ